MARLWASCLRFDLLTAAFLSWRRPAANAGALILGTDSIRSFYFAVQQLSLGDAVKRSLSRSCRCHSPRTSNSCDVCRSGTHSTALEATAEIYGRAFA